MSFSEISQFMMSHYDYISGCFERANQVLSSMKNDKHFATSMFKQFFEDLNRFCYDSMLQQLHNKQDFVKLMINRMKLRLKLNDNNVKNINYARISLKNSEIINKLMESKEYIQIVENDLTQMYQQICKVNTGKTFKDKAINYFTSKFFNSSGMISYIFGPTIFNKKSLNSESKISNFVIIYAFQTSLCLELKDMIKNKINNRRENGAIEKIKPFLQNKLIDLCILVKYDGGWSTLYYLAASYGDEEIVELLCEEVDNDIIKYKCTRNKIPHFCFNTDVDTGSPLDAAMQNGHWRLVKFISLVLLSLLFFFLFFFFVFLFGEEVCRFNKI